MDIIDRMDFVNILVNHNAVDTSTYPEYQSIISRVYTICSNYNIKEIDDVKLSKNKMSFTAKRPTKVSLPITSTSIDEKFIIEKNIDSNRVSILLEVPV